MKEAPAGQSGSVLKLGRQPNTMLFFEQQLPRARPGCLGEPASAILVIRSNANDL
jgi:hypothetical protein